MEGPNELMRRVEYDNDSSSADDDDDASENETCMLNEHSMQSIRRNDKFLKYATASWYVEDEDDPGDDANTVDWVKCGNDFGSNVALKEMMIQGFREGRESFSRSSNFVHFCHALSRNRSLEELNIYYCTFDTELTELALQSLVPFFQHNGNLRRIKFVHCTIDFGNMARLSICGPTSEDLLFTPPPSLETVYQLMQQLSDHDRRLYLNRRGISLPVMAIVLEHATQKVIRKCTTLAHSSTALGQYNDPQDSVYGFVGGNAANLTAAAIAKATANNEAIRSVYAIFLVLPGDFAALRTWYDAVVDPDAAAIQQRLQARCIELVKEVPVPNPRASSGPFLVFVANESKTGPEGVAIMKYEKLLDDMKKTVADNGLGQTDKGTKIGDAIKAGGSNGCLWKNAVWIKPVSETVYNNSSAGTRKRPSQAFLTLKRDGEIV